MRNETSHTSAYNAVPGGKVHGVELCFDNLCNVVENASLLECKRDTVNCVLLHFLTHICVLYDCVFSLLLVNATMRHTFLLVDRWFPQHCFFYARVHGHLLNFNY